MRITTETGEVEQRMRYQISEQDNGFLIDGLERKPVQVTLNESQTRILVQLADHDYTYAFNPYAFRLIIEKIISLTTMSWNAQPGKSQYAIESWMRRQTGRILNHDIHEQWKRLLDKIPEEKRDVLRAFFTVNVMGKGVSEAEKTGELDMWPELYTPAFIRLRCDLNSRALAQILSQFDTFAVVNDSPVREKLSELRQQLRKLTHGRSYSIQLLSSSDNEEKSSTDTEAERAGKISQLRCQILALLQDQWLDFLAGNKPLTPEQIESIHRFPTGLHPGVLRSFMQGYRPERVLAHRLEWALFQALWVYDTKLPFMLALPAEIHQAMKLYHDYYVWELKLQRQISRAQDPEKSRPSKLKIERYGEDTGRMQDMIKFLDDYAKYRAACGNPLSGEERLPSIMRQALACYQNMQSPLPLLPLPLCLERYKLDIPGITLLTTREEIIEAAKQVDSKIYQQYDRKCMTGKAWLFYVDYKEEAALIVMDEQGNFSQAVISLDRRSLALNYAYFKLTEWCQPLYLFNKSIGKD